MKKLFSTVAALILAANLWAGVPQGFSFQAVVRNAQGELVQNSSNVSVKVSILKDAADDNSVVYAETATAETNANGLMSLQIGNGTAISGSFDKIDWAQGTFFVKTEIDIEGGENYSISSVQQLLSVPFAMYAGNVPTKVSELENDAKFVSTDTLKAYAANINILKNTIMLANYVNADTLANYVSTKTLNSYAKTDQNISSFTNDAKYISEDTLSAYALKSELPDGVDLSTYLHNGSNISNLNNDAKYVKEGENISKLNNDAKYVKEGENISKLNNDAKYISKSEVDEKLASLNSQLAGEGMVDLGLPSGTLWATCNVGATQPTAAGYYFAWGETSPKESYSQETYTYKKNDAGTGYVKYGDDGVTTLKPEDDAATVNMGERWAIPTLNQWMELYDNCYWQYTTTYNGLNMSGYIVYKIKNEADKGKLSDPLASYTIEDTHIFLPMAGSKANTSTSGFNELGSYWTSDYYSSLSCYCVLLRSTAKSKSSGNRRYGIPVRAVTTASVKNAQNAVNATNAVNAQYAENLSESSIKYINSLIDKAKQDVAFNIMEGEINGVFSVSATKRVVFSKGNLQYNTNTKQWRFAEEQYITTKKANRNSNYYAYYLTDNGNYWTDLFCWGTSGWSGSGIKYYSPVTDKMISDDMTTSNKPNNDNFYIGGNASNSLTGSYANADWGVYNAISNGENKAGVWRTMTKDEWDYMLNSRPNANKLRCRFRISYSQNTASFPLDVNKGIDGFVLLPDNWLELTANDNSDIVKQLNNKAGTNENVVKNEIAFKDIETKYGVVFLPDFNGGCGRIAPYYENGTYHNWVMFTMYDPEWFSTNTYTAKSYYWTATPFGSYYIYTFDPSKSNSGKMELSENDQQRNYFNSVRLVRDYNY